MLTQTQKDEIGSIAARSLDDAEQIWDEVGDKLVLTANSKAFARKLAESIETQIPGYPSVELGKPKVDDFIAIVADMRGSTNHLLQAISLKIAKISQLQRVFYETSALLPSLTKAIEYEDGKTTEYLGDGVLGLFCLDKQDRSKTIYAANEAASKCINAVKTVINPLLYERYSLPELQIGVGLAYSKAVVTLVGLPDFMQPKVFGECVFRATKLSKGYNEVMIDEALKCIWPTSKEGVLQFQPVTKGDVKGYLITRSTK